MSISSAIIIIGITAVLFMAYRILEAIKASQEGKKDDQAMQMLQKHLFEIQQGIKEQDKTLQQGLKSQDKTLQEQLNRSQEALQQQFASTSKIVREVTVELGKIQDTNKQVVGFAEQLKTLENTLKNPKQRGILGEFFLENLLSNVLPPSSFQMQYAFNSGLIVDAIIRVNNKIIPIDAKFSLENYNKIMEENNDTIREGLQKDFKADLKKRIDETGKYVKPEEGTTEFAFMFIPADGVFYNLLTHKVGALEVNTSDLIDYAFRKHVILVSPMTFYAYLQTVMHALRALAIEESAKEIQKRVGDLHRHMSAYQDYMMKLGGHLSTTVNSFNNAGKEFMKIDKDVVRITEGASGGDIDVQYVDKPKAFEEEVSYKVSLKSPKKEADQEVLL